jgi:hypothetical protein
MDIKGKLIRKNLKVGSLPEGRDQLFLFLVHFSGSEIISQTGVIGFASIKLYKREFLIA